MYTTPTSVSPTHSLFSLAGSNFKSISIHEKIIHLVEPGLVGHLGQSPPDDEDLWTLLSNFELVEPDEKKEGKSQRADHSYFWSQML